MADEDDILAQYDRPLPPADERERLLSDYASPFEMSPAPPEGYRGGYDSKRTPEMSPLDIARAMVPPGSRPEVHGAQSPEYWRFPSQMEWAMTFMSPVKGGVPLARPQGRAAIKSQREGTAADTLAAAEAGTHLKQLPSGKYSGAPEDITSPQALGNRRKEIRDSAEEGAKGRDWYERTRDDIALMTGYNKKTGEGADRANLASFELGATSPQATPETNLGFTLQGHNAAIAGHPRDIVRFSSIAKAIEKAVAGDMPKLGAKTGVYETNINPAKPEATTGTNDIWHSRVFGYKDPGTDKPFSGTPTAQMHAFMDGETALVSDALNRTGAGGFKDWTSPRVQAAVWVNAKAKDIMAKAAEKGRTISREDAMAEATKTYGDFFPKYSAYDMHEAAPYAASGHLEGFQSLPQATRDAYSQLPGSSWATAPGGRDAIYHTIGMHTLPTSKAQGFYKGPKGPEYNPAEAARPLVDLDPGKHGPGIPEHTKELLNAAGAIRGLAGVQGGVGWVKPILNDKGMGVADTLFAQSKAPITREQLAGANASADKSGLMAIDLGEGRMMAFDPNFSKSPKDIEKARRGGLGKDLAPGAEAKRMRREGDYFGLEGELIPANAGKGMATDKALAVLDKLHPDVQRRLSDSPYITQVARDMVKRDSAFAKEHGLPVRDDVTALRDAMSQPGWLERLRKMRADGVPLPGIVVGGLTLEQILSRYDGERE